MNKVIYTAAIILIAISLNAQIELINSKIGIGTSTPSADVHLRGNNGTTEFKLETNKFSLMGGNVGIGTAAPQARLDISNGRLRLSDYGNNAVSGAATSILGVEADGDVVEIDLSELTTGETSTTGAIGSENPGISTVLFPEGAFYNGIGTNRGAIEINLPQLWTNTMMSLEIEIYDHSRQESFTVKCGGFNNTGRTWANTFARVEGSPEVNRNFNVRFGSDSDNVKIWIGELTSVWQHPKITVTQAQFGHRNTEVDKWDDGWSIDIVQSFDDAVSYTQSNTQVNNFVRKGNNAYYNAGKVGIGTSAPTHRLHAVNNANSDGFYFLQTGVTGAEKDVFTIEDQDVVGSGQDKSSVLKVLKSANIHSTAWGFSLNEITYTGNDPGYDKYYIMGNRSDEGAPEWGVQISDNEIWSTGGLRLGATNKTNGTYDGGSFIVNPDGSMILPPYGNGDFETATNIGLKQLMVDGEGNVVTVSNIADVETKTVLDDDIITELESKVSQLESMVADLLGKLENLVSDDYDTFDHIVDLSHDDVQFAGLGQNRPNPTANDAVIDYLLPDAFNDANIRFYTVSGEVIREIELTEPGIGKLIVNTIDLPNGSFMYSLIVDGDLIDTKTMIIQK